MNNWLSFWWNLYFRILYFTFLLWFIWIYWIDRLSFWIYSKFLIVSWLNISPIVVENIWLSKIKSVNIWFIFFVEESAFPQFTLFDYYWLCISWFLSKMVLFRFIWIRNCIKVKILLRWFNIGSYSSMQNILLSIWRLSINFFYCFILRYTWWSIFDLRLVITI